MNTDGEAATKQPMNETISVSDEQTRDFMRWLGMATGMWIDFDSAPSGAKEMWRRKATEYYKKNR